MEWPKKKETRTNVHTERCPPVHWGNITEGNTKGSEPTRAQSQHWRVQGKGMAPNIHVTQDQSDIQLMEQRNSTTAVSQKFKQV